MVKFKAMYLCIMYLYYRITFVIKLKLHARVCHVPVIVGKVGCGQCGRVARVVRVGRQERRYTNLIAFFLVLL